MPSRGQFRVFLPTHAKFRRGKHIAHGKYNEFFTKDLFPIMKKNRNKRILKFDIASIKPLKFKNYKARSGPVQMMALYPDSKCT